MVSAILTKLHERSRSAPDEGTLDVVRDKAYFPAVMLGAFQLLRVISFLRKGDAEVTTQR